MIVARDQFLSWPMISIRQSDWSIATAAGTKYSFFQARYALYHGLNLLGIEPGAHILVPAYICRAAVDPLIAYGANVDFYAVSRDCSVDCEDLESRVTSNTQAVLVVHYFGYPQALDRIKQLCDVRNLLLIEDCAHVLSGSLDGQPMGTIGDAAVFSWRKFLPIYDGGELVLNRPVKRHPIRLKKESGLFTLRVGANMLNAALSQTRHPVLRLGYRMMQAGETLFRRCAKSQLRNASMMQAETSSVAFDLDSVDWPMSRLSRWTKDHANIANIVGRRRRNYKMLLRELSGSGAQPLFSSLPPDVCPWVFPIMFPRVKEALGQLRRRGIPAVGWDGVRHPHVPCGQFIDSDFLYQNLVFLPVHQCLEDEDMLKVVWTVRDVCAR